LVDAKVFSNAVTGIQGFTAFSKGFNAVIVAFRGSSNIQNWILNIGTTRSSYSLCTNCSVHTGFLSGYNAIATAVRNAVQNLKAKYRNSRLLITGHSLGGALAILCTADLKHLFGTVDLTYTFGQPRIGN
jgi:predicted lipase